MNKTKNCNYVSAAVMALAWILLFVPFWKYDGMSTSIMGYVGFPSSHGELDEYLRAALEPSYLINEIVLMPLFNVFALPVSVALCIIFSKKTFCCIFPVVCGAMGVWGYLSHPVFQMGSGWAFHLIVCIAVIIVGVLGCLNFLQEKRGYVNA